LLQEAVSLPSGDNPAPCHPCWRQCPSLPLHGLRKARSGQS